MGASGNAELGARDGALPRPRTTFVGRDSELDQVRRLLRENRLLTLTGAGGAGKTRLSIALAASVQDDYPDGVHFVSLASIRDPALVAVSIAQSLGLQDARGVGLLEHISDYVGDRAILLVLDNFEQVLDAAPFLRALLDACPELRVLVTSRSPLHLAGEQEFAVPALRLPASDASTAEAVAAAEAAQLFASRASAALPDFAIDDGNAAAVAEILRRVDGLPLAIELAAARIKVLPPQAILDRLRDSLTLLVGAGRDLPDRQRTLRATIAWSYDLLSEPARLLLAVTSVFRGGMELSSVEAVVADSLDLGVAVLDAVEELVNHSLLRAASTPAGVRAGGPRYAMHETLREFAAEQLTLLLQAEAVRAAHASHFSSLAVDLLPPPVWPNVERMNQLELDHDNFRAALEWYEAHDPGTALELANRLTAFWSARGYFSEARQRLQALLKLVDATDPNVVGGLNGVGWLATDQGDAAEADELLTAALTLAEATHDEAGQRLALFYRGRSRLVSGDAKEGKDDIERALRLSSGSDDDPMTAAGYWFAGMPHVYFGEIRVAHECFQRSYQLATALGVQSVALRGRQLMAVTCVEMGQLDEARAAMAVAFPGVREIGDRFSIPVGLSTLSGLAARSARPRAAMLLAGAAAANEELNRTFRPLAMQSLLDGWLRPVREQLGEQAAQQLEEAGRQLSLDEAVALGLDDTPEAGVASAEASALSPRELEVAELVAGGMSNKEIAAQLVLSVRTVETHVDHALTKLGLRSRTQLAAWVHARDSATP